MKTLPNLFSKGGITPLLGEEAKGDFVRNVCPVMHTALIFSLVITGFFIWGSDGDAVDTGDFAPDFDAVTIDGKEISYSRDIKGKKPLYIIFWATW